MTSAISPPRSCWPDPTMPRHIHETRDREDIMLSVEEASGLILADVAPLGVEEVRLADSLGRILARDVVSPVSLPPWDNSSMDGYAVRAADVEHASEAHP